MEVSSLANNNTTEEKIGFVFTPINDISSYSNIFQKENMKLLEKWGLKDMECIKFRFNINFNRNKDNLLDS